jgi:hypothetical protein
MSVACSEGKSRREAIVAKVKALLAKTIQNGCTEDEALSAAALAGKLMEQHDLAYEDVEREVRDERYGARSGPLDRSKPRRCTLLRNETDAEMHEIFLLCGEIAKFFDCEVWGTENELTYFGAADDTELAHRLTDLIRVAMDFEWASYLNGDGRDPTIHVRTLRLSFVVGMMRRLDERLKAVKQERSGLPTGRTLVEVKAAVVSEKFATFMRDSGLQLESVDVLVYDGSNDAYAAGQAAGDRVGLGSRKISSG